MQPEWTKFWVQTGPRGIRVYFCLHIMPLGGKIETTQYRHLQAFGLVCVRSQRGLRAFRIIAELRQREVQQRFFPNPVKEVSLNLGTASLKIVKDLSGQKIAFPNHTPSKVCSFLVR